MVAAKEDDRALQLVKRLDRMKSARGTLDSHLQEVADRVAPTKAYITTKPTRGQPKKVSKDLFDDTPEEANRDMAAGLFSHLLSGQFFALKARDKDLNDSEDNTRWFMDTTNTLLEELAVSNWNNEIFEFLLDLGWCGTPTIGVWPGKETLLSFTTYNISQVWIAENKDKQVDTHFHEFGYTARQAVQHWGLENCGQDVREAYLAPDKMDTEFKFLHAITPREDPDHAYPALKTRQPISSEWVDIKAKKLMLTDGYYEYPMFSPRWMRRSGDLYGRSQGMAKLPTIKMTSEMKRSLVEAMQMVIRPPILSASDAFIGGNKVRIKAGAILIYNKKINNNQKPEPFFTIKDAAALRVAYEAYKEEQNNIRKGFYNDLFAVLGELDKNVTAFEIAKRLEENHGRIIAPIGRIQTSFNGIIRRSLGILGRAGRLKPAPPDLVGKEYEIEYVSKLALALKIIQLRSLTDGLEVVESLGEKFPELYDNYDIDKIARGVPVRVGWSTDWLRDIADRDEMREQRAEDEAEAKQAEMMIAGADAVPKLQKPTEKGSPLAELAGVA